MNGFIVLSQIELIGVGLALIIFPLVFVFAFAAHPRLLRPRLLGPEELVRRAHGNKLVHFGHVLVTLNTSLLIVVALHFMILLNNGAGAWAGFVGGVIAILGAIFLAVDKGALCLTMSAFDTLPEKNFRPNHAGRNDIIYKKRLVETALGNCFSTHRFYHSSHRLAQDSYSLSLAKYFVFDRRIVDGYSRWC